MKVSEVLRKLRDDGWYLQATRGSHRQSKHATKSGRVSVTVQTPPVSDEVHIPETTGALQIVRNG
jgi:predicted RNA binding protein YcfA (HicA-like mRNA interferase family)